VWFGPVVVDDDQPARIGLELLYRMQPDPDAYRNEWAERTMNARAQGDSILP
jgi:hypothetical protein